jgi:hypothetical protein
MRLIYGVALIAIATWLALCVPWAQPGSSDPAIYPTYTLNMPTDLPPVPSPPPGWPAGPPAFDVHNP